MMKEKEIETILAHCLQEIEAGTATIDDCLRRYPEQAEALRPLLHTVAAVRRAPAVEPPAAFQAAASTRLLNLIAARQHSTPAAPLVARRRWRTILLRVAIPVLAASFLLTGTAFAARHSLPDSPLYPVKRTVEQVQLAVSPGDARRARLVIRFLDQRALEAAAMIRSGNIERSRQTNQDYLRLLGEIETLTQRLPADRPESAAILTVLRDRLAAQEAVFEQAQNAAPQRVRPLLRPTLTQIRQTQATIRARLNHRWRQPSD